MTGEQTAWMEAEWWTQAGPEDIWNGPGYGISEHTKMLVERLDPAHMLPGQIIDLGCGDGRLLSRMAELFPERAFLGLDIVTRSPGYPMPPNAHMVGGLDGRRLPLYAQSAAGAYSVLLFQHLPEDAVRGYLTELARVLNADARLAIQYVYKQPDTEPDGFLHYSYDETTMEGWARAAGFIEVWTSIEEGSEWAWLEAKMP